jgi:hypothetical protein
MERTRFHRRWQLAWGAAKVYLVVLGFFSFPMFIAEEATQVAIWGTWQASKNDMPVLYQGVRTVQTINRLERGINTWLGWLHPIGYQAYNQWCDATDYWIQASTVKILDHEPGLLEGEAVTIPFRAQNYDLAKDHVEARSGRVAVLLDEEPTDPIPLITGMVSVREGQIIIDARKSQPVTHRRKEGHVRSRLRRFALAHAKRGPVPGAIPSGDK